MKKRVTIHVMIDDTLGESSGAGRLPMHNFMLPPGPADEEYVVLLHAPFQNGEMLPDTMANRMDIAAHELGHVLSAIYNQKGGMAQDPRATEGFDYTKQRPSMAQASLLWSSELVAWYLAEKMRAPEELNQILKSTSLETYRLFLDHAEREMRRKNRFKGRQ